MKTLNLQNAEIKEMILQPINGIITVSYNVKDDVGNVIFTKLSSFKVSDLPVIAQTSLTNFAQKLLDKVTSQEGL